ncbi:hypothetical protein E2C01_031030 [Portunus trituberculatus]|uniref:Uncharacterized protein n=1 Tax=Portunus trituberculatus TaxID=210409 RepID=A0A5B7EYZ5_PORTR|nr:hypothetical protein [Portunus trituberculatus]
MEAGDCLRHNSSWLHLRDIMNVCGVRGLVGMGGNQTMESRVESIDIGNGSLLRIDKFCYPQGMTGAAENQKPASLLCTEWCPG